MKILAVGGTGRVGSEVVRALADQGHSVVTAGRSSGDFTVDNEDKASIQAMFDQLGEVDAIISAAGDGVMAPFDAEDDHAYDRALNSKAMGQVNLARIGQKYLSKNGSNTLTSGAAARYPMAQTAAIAMGTAALDAFAAAAALELQDGKRINTISLTLIKESAEKLGMDTTYAIPAATAAQLYVNSVLGQQTGHSFEVAA